MHEQVRQAAILAREGAYAPYSNFQVGAALLAANGEIFTGANVENASYGATICAERAALVNAVNGGQRRFLAVAIHAGAQQESQAVNSHETAVYAYPCGICRQMLAEFCAPDMPIYLVKAADDYETSTFAELLPHAFNKTDLDAAYGSN